MVVRRLGDEDLMRIGQAYIEFLHRAGQAMVEQKVPEIFSRDCRKIVNGITQFDKGDIFGVYLWKAREIYGRWAVSREVSLSPSPHTDSVTIKYTVKTDKAELLVIAILTMDAAGLITEIDEVDHEVRPGNN